MGINAFIQETAKRLGFVDVFEKSPEYGQQIELMLPAEFPKVKSYLEFEFVRGVYVMHSSVFGPLSPGSTDYLKHLTVDRVNDYGELHPAVLINPMLDIAEVPGILFVRSYQTMFWRDATESVLSSPKTLPLEVPEAIA